MKTHVFVVEQGLQLAPRRNLEPLRRKRLAVLNLRLVVAMADADLAGQVIVGLVRDTASEAEFLLERAIGLKAEIVFADDADRRIERDLRLGIGFHPGQMIFHRLVEDGGDDLFGDQLALFVEPVPERHDGNAGSKFARLGFRTGGAVAVAPVQQVADGGLFGKLFFDDGRHIDELHQFRALRRVFQVLFEDRGIAHPFVGQFFLKAQAGAGRPCFDDVGVEMGRQPARRFAGLVAGPGHARALCLKPCFLGSFL